ncbi:MAG: methionyl-tRNA formyltransferase [Bacteroidia bacterium]
MNQEINKSLRIIFLGTPEFAVESLKILVENNYEVVGVITSPDQPAGRGLKIKESPVKQFALQHHLKVLQPVKLSDPLFLEEVKQLQADLQIVVAFRMMPESLWSMPHLGTFNLHASLLPQYRGAAPINRAIMNGEQETGVTTFFLKHEIDTGNILFAERVQISENETAGELHDKLKTTGAQLVLKTMKAIESGSYNETVQQQIINNDDPLKTAPKIFKEDCEIDWSKGAIEIYNHIRGLSPYPTAFFKIKYPDEKEETIKIFKADKIIDLTRMFTGEVFSDDKTYFNIPCNGGYLTIEELQIPGKKRMKVDEFLRGHKVDDCTLVDD